MRSEDVDVHQLRQLLVLWCRRGGSIHSQPAFAGLLDENSNESREGQSSSDQRKMIMVSTSVDQIGLISTVKASEMLQDLSEDSSISSPNPTDYSEPKLARRLARLEALLEMMLAKVWVMLLHMGHLVQACMITGDGNVDGPVAKAGLVVNCCQHVDGCRRLTFWN